MQYLAPLLQTILWVALIGAIVWRFHRPIYGILSALQRRVESGSAVKAGPIELAEALRPQLPEEQRSSIDREVRQIAAESAADQPAATPPPLEQLRNSYLQIEDLALRAVQAIYNVPISRQVAIGPSARFDGAFVKLGRFYLVEVKYLPGSPKPSRVHDALKQVELRLHAAKLSNVCIVLAVVLDTEDYIPLIAPLTSQLLPSASSAYSTDVRFFSKESLVAQYVSHGDQEA